MSNDPRNRAPTEDPPYKVYRSGEEPGPGRSGPEERPYKVYRSVPKGLRARLRGEEDIADEPRRGGDDGPGGPGGRRGPGGGGSPGPGRRGAGLPWLRRRWSVRRVLKYLVLAVIGWLVLSLVLFLVSASIQSGSVPDSVSAALSPGGNMLTSPNTVLVIGTDQRPKGSKEPGAFAGGIRSDTMMLWRIGGGTSRRLSIPRDTEVPIPGYGVTKINAAYSYGGPALAIKTVENLTGVKINHLIIVNLANFPKFIDDIGGVDGPDRADLLEHQRRRQERRLLAVPAARHASSHRDPGPHPGPDPGERLQRRLQRPHPRGLPAEDPQRHQVTAGVPRHLLPPAVGVLGRAEGRAHRHGRAHAHDPVRRPPRSAGRRRPTSSRTTTCRCPT